MKRFFRSCGHIGQSRQLFALVFQRLRSLGFRVAAEPQGAFYIYADVSDIAADAESLARRLIEEAGVAATPGLDFGHHLPRQHLRIAYTTRRERLLEAVERIARLQL